MAAFYTPGPKDHYIRFRDGSVSYLGTATTAPEVESRPAFLNVINDVGGRTVPTQKVRDRIQDVVSTTLNRFDWATYKSISGAQENGGPGVLIDNNLTHGTLVLGSSDFELIIVNSLALTAGTVPADFPVGRRYFSAVLLGARESSVGSRVEEVSLVFECNELFVPETRVWRFYSELATDVTGGLPAPI